MKEWQFYKHTFLEINIRSQLSKYRLLLSTKCLSSGTYNPSYHCRNLPTATYHFPSLKTLKINLIGV